MKEAVIKVKVDSKQAQKFLRDLGKDVNNLAKSSDDTSKSLSDFSSGLSKLKTENLEFNKNLDQTIQATETLSSSVSQLSVANNLFAKSSGIAKQAQIAFNVVANMNPYILIATAIGATVYAVYELVTAYDELSDSSKVLFAILGGPIGIAIVLWNEMGDIVDKFPQKMKEFSKSWISAFTPIGLGLRVIIALYERFFGEIVDVEKEQKKNMDAENTRHKERLANIKQLREEEKKAHEDRQKAFDTEIQIAENLGKSTRALRISKQEDLIAELRNIIQTNADAVESYRQRYLNIAKIQGLSEEEFIEKAKAQGVDFNKIQESIADQELLMMKKVELAESELFKIRNENRKNFQQGEKFDINALYQAIEDLENKYSDSKLTREQQEVNAVADKYFALIEEAKKHGIDVTTLEENQEAELKEIRNRYANERAEDVSTQLNVIQKLRDEFHNKTLTQEEIEQNALNEKYKVAIENAKKFYGADAPEVLELEEAYQEEFTDITQKWAKKRKDDADREAKELLDQEKEKWEKILQIAEEINAYVQQAISATNDILDQRSEQRLQKSQEEFRIEEEALKASLANRLISEEEYAIEIARLEQNQKEVEKQEAMKAFKREKANAVTQAGIETSLAILKAFAQYGPPPSPVGIAAGAGALAIGGIQTAAILSKKFMANIGGIVPGGQGVMDSVPSLLTPGEAVINAESSSLFRPLLSAINESTGGRSLMPDGMSAISETQTQSNRGPAQAYVVESQSRDVRKRIERFEANNKI